MTTVHYRWKRGDRALAVWPSARRVVLQIVDGVQDVVGIGNWISITNYPLITSHSHSKAVQRDNFIGNMSLKR